jgi:hypothetical protein
MSIERALEKMERTFKERFNPKLKDKEAANVTRVLFDTCKSSGVRITVSEIYKYNDKNKDFSLQFYIARPSGKNVTSNVPYVKRYDIVDDDVSDEVEQAISIALASISSDANKASYARCFIEAEMVLADIITKAIATAPKNFISEFRSLLEAGEFFVIYGNLRIAPVLIRKEDVVQMSFRYSVESSIGQKMKSDI